MSSFQGQIENNDIADTAESVTVSGVGTNRSTALKPGYYSLLSDVDVYLKRGGAAVTATTGCFLLKANVYWPLQVKTSDVGTRDQVATLQAAAGGTLRITKHG